MSVGMVGQWNPYNKPAVRATPNPFDKSTIISIWPKPIYENKITLSPGEFEIPAGSYENPAVVIVGPSSWWREVNEQEPLLEISVPSSVIADSLCRDWMNGMLGCDMVTAKPGLIWLPHEVKLDVIKKEHKGVLDKAKEQQDNYFRNLVKLADSLWARTNGNPLAIHEDAKMAAKYLNEERDWLNYSPQYAPKVVRCVACGSQRNPDFPVCPTCKAVVDHELAAKLKIKFAE